MMPSRQIIASFVRRLRTQFGFLRRMQLDHIRIAIVACLFIAPPLQAAEPWHISTIAVASSDAGSFDKPQHTLRLPALDWQSTTLPDIKPRQVLPANMAFAERKSTQWYRILVPPTNGKTEDLHACTGQEDCYFYLPRWQTIGKIAVYVDQQLAYRSMGGAVWNGYNHPLWIKLANAHEAPPQEIILRIDHLDSAGSAISSAWIGDESDLKWRYMSRAWLQAKLPEILSAAFLIIGLYAFSLWLKRRHESTYLLFFTASLLSYVRCLQYYVGTEPLPISDAWFSWININASGWLVLNTYFFCYRLHGKRYTKLEFTCLLLMALATLVTLPNLVLPSNLGTFSSLANLVIFGELVILTIVMAFASWRSHSREGLLLSFMHALNIPLGMHDVMMQNYQVSIEHIYLLPYTTMGPLFVLILVVNRRFLQALQAVEEANKTLEIRLQQREQALAESHAKLRKIEQEQAISEERQRLVRDMHDGLGASLISALAVAERGQLGADQLAQVLKECIDDLKLTIDSLEPMEGDVPLILATLRYRLEPRLVQAGLVLHWQVNPLPPLHWLSPHHALHLLRIIQEIFTNIIKHAKASKITLMAKVSTDQIEIVITDNGKGFDMTTVAAGRGLSHMQHRAKQLNARLACDSSAEGTRVTLQLPLQ